MVKKEKINKVRGALSILYKLDKKVKVVIGVETIDQLSQIVKEINKNFTSTKNKFTNKIFTKNIQLPY